MAGKRDNFSSDEDERPQGSKGSKGKGGGGGGGNKVKNPMDRLQFLPVNELIGHLNEQAYFVDSPSELIPAVAELLHPYVTTTSNSYS